ncbi:22042_t:CDS:2 [Gigaspora rosea]|nr:22042_t:CDS:2 [Gigaspora rosea]
MGQSTTMGWSGPIPYLNIFAQEVHDINHKVIDERKLYGEAWGKARAALIVAVQRNDYNFITMLSKYLNNCQSDSDESRPKGTDRIRYADEPSKKAKR